MNEPFASMLLAGGHANSLGRVNDVIAIVLKEKPRLEELYDCMFEDDPWVRMRAADAFEKICREHPDWMLPYIDRFAHDLASSAQPSIQWHLAQIYRQVELTDKQKKFAVDWLQKLLSDKNADWIAAANAMTTLTQFTKDGFAPTEETVRLLKLQQDHKSNAVVQRASKCLAELPAS